MSAITRLADKVEAGTATPADFVEKGLMENISAPKSAWKAYNGSLDAAMALHEVVLPGWDWSVDNIGRSQFCAYVYDGRKSIGAFNANPARAWLLAILRALAQANPQPEAVQVTGDDGEIAF